MKRFLALLLVFAMALSLCACKSGKKRVYNSHDDDDDDDDGDSGHYVEATEAPEKPSDILIGKWEHRSEDEKESVLEFMEDGDTVIGNWTVYDYIHSTWAEYSFTVKDRTDNSMTLMLNDGTLSVNPYQMLGHELYFGGELYKNAELTLEEYDPTIFGVMIHNGSNYEIYKNIYLGLSYDSLKAAYPELSELDEYNNATLSSLGEFDNASFYFLNDKLSSVRLSEYDDDVLEEFVNSFIQSANAEFGDYTPTSRDDDSGDYNYDYYEWKLEKGTIKLTVSSKTGQTVPWWASINYSYY